MRASRSTKAWLVALAGFGCVPSAARADGPERSEVAGFGFLAVLAKEPPPPPSSWWLRKDLGPPDPSTPLGRMWGPSIHDAAGAPGLALSSTGLSGGRARSASARASAVATVFGGKGADDLDAFDNRRGDLAETHVARPPKEPEAHTPPDVIQRIIQRHLGLVRVCYDDALRTRPALAGRVAVKFVIARSGAVALASDAGSDMDDRDVVACVVRTFDALVFPASSDSVTTVVYPFVFSPGEPR